MSALDDVRRAISALRVARDCLARAGAPKALERVRAALKSAEGARRHAELRAVRAEMLSPRQGCQASPVAANTPGGAV